MKCKKCGKAFKDLVRHLRNSNDCQFSYDFEALSNDRKTASLARKHNYNKTNYEENKERILANKKKNYKENKSKFKQRNAENYKKNKPFICQRKRFKKYFKPKQAMSYINHQQEHLFFHTLGFCQPETMSYLNHSIEFEDGLCNYCDGMTCIKIIGVNRLVCLKCKRAHCYSVSFWSC